MRRIWIVNKSVNFVNKILTLCLIAKIPCWGNASTHLYWYCFSLFLQFAQLWYDLNEFGWNYKKRPDFYQVSFCVSFKVSNRQRKIVDGSEILCNWAITFNDIEIWEEKDRDDSIYIHRICANPEFRGNRYIDDQIVTWAKPYAQSIGKRFVRLDTLGYNKKLIEHYSSAGFHFLGMHRLTNTSSLPQHYQDEPNCCLFEIDLDKKWCRSQIFPLLLFIFVPDASYTKTRLHAKVNDTCQIRIELITF